MMPVLYTRQVYSMSDKPHVKFTCEPCNFNAEKRSNWNDHIRTSKHVRLNSTDGQDTAAHLCESCDYQTTYIKHQNAHAFSVKHQRNVKPIVYECVACNVTCCNASSFQRHNETKYHVKNLLRPTNREPKIDVVELMIRENANLTQLIGKIVERLDNSYQNDAIQALIADNVELKQLAIKAIECNHQSVNVINSNNTNNNNFNINVFLNEKCANAKNMSDFIAGIEITHEDLENNAELGFVGGMVKIITDNLNKLDITERPIHCTDSKRDILYIKDDNKWSKEGSFDKMNKYIQEISGKNVRKLLKWKRENPDYADGDSEFSIKSLKIHMTLMAGAERDKFYPRVIHEVSKLSIIDKNAA